MILQQFSKFVLKIVPAEMVQKEGEGGTLSGLPDTFPCGTFQGAHTNPPGSAGGPLAVGSRMVPAAYLSNSHI